MKRAFTLLELLTVIAIMASLSVAAIGGYRAAVKGMKDRGALTVVQTFIDQVRQRAVIDRQPVTVFFYDELRQKEDSAEQRDLVGSGIAIAVKAVGRVSAIEGDYILDEFNDLNVDSDAAMEDEEEDAEDNPTDYGKMAMRIYRMADGQAVDVSPKVEPRDVNEEFLLTGKEIGNAATGSEGDGDNEKKLTVNAYRALNGNPFSRGDAYGTEFSAIRLPNGYFFGGSVPTTEGRNILSALRMDIKADGTGAKPVTINTFENPNSSTLTGAGTTDLVN